MKLVQKKKLVKAKQRNANVSPTTLGRNVENVSPTSLERNVMSAVEIIGCHPKVSLIQLKVS